MTAPHSIRSMLCDDSVQDVGLGFRLSAFSVVHEQVCSTSMHQTFEPRTSRRHISSRSTTRLGSASVAIGILFCVLRRRCQVTPMVDDRSSPATTKQGRWDSHSVHITRSTLTSLHPVHAPRCQKCQRGCLTKSLSLYRSSHSFPAKPYGSPETYRYTAEQCLAVRLSLRGCTPPERFPKASVIHLSRLLLTSKSRLRLVGA